MEIPLSSHQNVDIVLFQGICDAYVMCVLVVFPAHIDDQTGIVRLETSNDAC